MTGKNSHLLLWLQYGLILSLAAGLVCCTRQTGAAASEALTLCIQTLIPSLLPFFIVSSLTVSCGAAQRLSRAFHRPMQRLFGLPGVCAPALILGLMGGYPVGARTVGELLQQKLCTRTQAQQLLRFCNNCGPAFILGAVGSGVFGSTAAGLLLYVTHILAAILTGLLLRPRWPEQAVPHTTAAPAAPLPFHRAFTGAVTASVTSVLNVCGFVIFFAVAVCLLRQSGVLPLLAGLLPLQDGMAQALLIGSLEMTNGVYALTASSIDSAAALTAAAFLLGWGGFSVHFQTLNVLEGCCLRMLPYFSGKLLHGVLAALLTRTAAALLPQALPTFGSVGVALPVFTGTTAAMAAGFLLLSAFFAILSCKSRRKHL